MTQAMDPTTNSVRESVHHDGVDITATSPGELTRIRNERTLRPSSRVAE